MELGNVYHVRRKTFTFGNAREARYRVKEAIQRQFIGYDRMEDPSWPPSIRSRSTWMGNYLITHARQLHIYYCHGGSSLLPWRWLIPRKPNCALNRGRPGSSLRFGG